MLLFKLYALLALLSVLFLAVKADVTGPLPANTCYEMLCDAVSPTCERNLSTFNSAVRTIASLGTYSIKVHNPNICPPFTVVLHTAIGSLFTWQPERNLYTLLHVKGNHRDGKDDHGNDKFKTEDFSFINCEATGPVTC